MSSRIHTVQAIRTTRRLLVFVLGALLMVGLLLVPGSTTSPASAAVAQAQTDPEPRSDYLVAFASGVAPEASDSTLAAADAVVSASIPALRLYAASLTDSAAAGAERRRAALREVEADRVREVEGTPNDPAVRRPVGAAEDRLGHGVRHGHPGRLRRRRRARHRRRRPTDDLAGQLVAGSLDARRWSRPPATRTATAPRWPASSPPATDNGRGIAGVGYARRLGHARHGPRRRRHRPGQRHHRGRRLGRRPRRRRHPDVVLRTRATQRALQAAVDYAWSKGVVLVAATGNDGPRRRDLPGRRREGRRRLVDRPRRTRSAASSNYGADTFLAAPGVGIVDQAGGGIAR